MYTMIVKNPFTGATVRSQSVEGLAVATLPALDAVQDQALEYSQAVADGMDTMCATVELINPQDGSVAYVFDPEAYGSFWTPGYASYGVYGDYAELAAELPY